MIPKFKNGSGEYNLYSEADLQEKKHVVSFSGGRTSAYLLYNLLLHIPRENLIVNFANTGREDPRTLDFVRDVQKDLSIPINWLEFQYHPTEKTRNGKPAPYHRVVSYETASRNGEPLKEYIEHTKYIPNQQHRICTVTTKIEVQNSFCKSLGLTNDNMIRYIGIRYDEPKRWSKNVNQFNEFGDAIAYPLVDWGTTKKDVLEFWAKASFDLQLNEPFGNCDLCFLKSTKKRIAVLKERPEIAKWWSELEEKVGMNWDREYSVKQLYKIATGEAMLDESKEQKNDISCLCNLD